MSHQSELISTDINAYLAQHERKELLRLLTCGSVDDGKSTLIGRLLYDTKMIYQDHLDALGSDSMKSGTTDDSFDLALLTDGLQAEREQGITIDVAYRYFSTAKRKFIIADTPGHEQYTRNMATGASNCELAIILIDARHGVLTQTRRHTFIASLLGIKHLIVAVNKMDLMDFSEKVFNDIRDDYLEFTSELDTGELTFIPISAKNGDNVVNVSENTPWYDGETLMWMLENVQISADKNFEDYDEELEMAFTPMAITLTLEDEIDISRGDMIAHSDNLPTTKADFMATVVWMNEKALLPGKQYNFKHTTKSTTGQINMIQHKVDVNTLETSPTPSLELNEIGLCEINLNEPIHFDDYKKSQGSGSFIIIDRLTNATVGAGMISDEQRTGKHISTVSAHVTTEERAARYGQKPVTVMFIGLSGSGKSTLAHALERRLFDMGRVSTVLDGKQMRLGISKDLPHDAEGRAENLRRSAFIAKYLNDAGLICCAAFVSPNLDSREHMISVIGEENCMVIYLNPPLEVCMQRDPSGLYAAEQNVPSGNVPGISFDYPEPERPDLILPTHELDVEECIDRIINVMKEQSVISPGR